MGDVPLVPEGDVLERGLRVGAHDAREPRYALRSHGVPFMRHRGGALLSLRERLLHLSDLRPREVTDLGREGVERGGEDRERRDVLRVAIARDHLAGGFGRLQIELRADILLHAGVDARVRSDRAGELSYRD